MKNPLRLEKIRKQESLLEKGVELYPHRWKKKSWKEKLSCSESLKEEAEELPEGESSKELFCIAGRLMRKRNMGKAAFFTLQDQSGQFQCYIRRDSFLKTPSQKDSNQRSASKKAKPADKAETPSHFNSWDLWKLSDIGDIFSVRGALFKTKKGEPSLKALDLKILCKSREPLPEKYHGLEDIELKYRFRHLDLVMNPDSRKIFQTRSQIIQKIRAFMNRAGFMEVETPVLQPLYGGAAAEPFETHFRRLGNQKMYLKISPEIYLKKLIVGGFEKVYEIGKNFRNEGIDRTHNPEFTMMEYYEAYTDYKDQMRFFKRLVKYVVKEIKGSLIFSYQGRELNFKNWEVLTFKSAIKKYSQKEPGLYESFIRSKSKWERLSLKRAIRKYSREEPSLYENFEKSRLKKDASQKKEGGAKPEKDSFKPFKLNPDKLSYRALLRLLKEHYPKADYSAFEVKRNQLSEEERKSLKEELSVMAFELIVEKHLWNPTFIIDFPAAVSPLTKDHRERHRLVERFEPYIAGMELGNAYTELNDPVEQRKRLEKQDRWSVKEKTEKESDSKPESNKKDSSQKRSPKSFAGNQKKELSAGPNSSGENRMIDESFLHALEVGMPPTGGVGLGIERLVMILTDQKSIRDCILFPAQKNLEKK